MSFAHGDRVEAATPRTDGGKLSGRGTVRGSTVWPDVWRVLFDGEGEREDHVGIRDLRALCVVEVLAEMDDVLHHAGDRVVIVDEARFGEWAIVTRATPARYWCRLNGWRKAVPYFRDEIRALHVIERLAEL